METILGIIFGVVVWFAIRVVLFGIYTVDQNERASKNQLFGRAERLEGKTTLDDPIAETSFASRKERERY